VISTRGNTHLGGSDIDDILVRHCVQDFKNKFGVELSGNRRALGRLRQKVVDAKIQLSSTLSADISALSLAHDHDYKLTISRALFEELC